MARTSARRRFRLTKRGFILPILLDANGDIRIGDGARLTGETLELAGGDITVSGGSVFDAPGGAIGLDAKGGIAIRDGALVSTTAFRGAPGEITLEAGEAVFVGGRISANVTLGDQAGNIFVWSPRLQVVDGGISADAIGSGSAGAITLHVGSLELRESAVVSASNVFGVAGGDIQVEATESVLIGGPRENESDPSRIISVQDGEGSAGRILVSTPRLDIEGGAISTRAEGSGSAGAIDLHVGELVVKNGGRVESETEDEGPGGDINVHANSIFIDTGGRISAATSGAGRGGGALR